MDDDILNILKIKEVIDRPIRNTIVTSVTSKGFTYKVGKSYKTVTRHELTIFLEELSFSRLTKERLNQIAPISKPFHKMFYLWLIRHFKLDKENG